MVVNVRLFGPFARADGRASVPVDAGDSPTCARVLAKLGYEAPALRPLLDGARLAVNHEFAAPDAPIAPGDEVALIGLVSGG